MTSNEKLTGGELFITSYEGLVPDEKFLRFFDNYQPAGIVLFADNCSNLKTLSESIDILSSRSSQPLLVAIDQEGGRVCRITEEPAAYLSAVEYGAMAEGDSGDLHSALAKYRTDLSAAVALMSELGINLLLGPVCDLRLFKGESALDGRTFGSDPALVASFIRETVKICHEGSLACCLKHAPGLGRLEVDPHHSLGEIKASLEDLRSTDFVPFLEGIRAGADSMMSSHFVATDIDQRPLTISKTATHNLIRQELSDSLPLITDDLNMGALKKFAEDGAVAYLALLAGHDLLLTRDFRSAEKGAIVLRERAANEEATCKRVAEALKRAQQLREKITQRTNTGA